MDILILSPVLGLRLKVAESGVRYYGDYVLVDILLEYQWTGHWHFLVQRTIRLNISQQMILQEQIVLDQLKAIQMNRYYEEISPVNLPEKVHLAHPTDYFEAIHSIVKKRVKNYFEMVLLPTYNQHSDDGDSLENIRKGLKAVLSAVERSNSFGR